MADQGQTKPTSRRRFIDVLLGGGIIGWLGTVIYPLFSFLKPPETPDVSVNVVSAGLAAEIPINSGQIVRFGRTPVLLIRTQEGDFRAFAGTCTHLDCIVQYRDDLHSIWCACHNGYYDLHGRNISGPPPRPLPDFEVNIVDDEVIISRPAPTA